MVAVSRFVVQNGGASGHGPASVAKAGVAAGPAHAMAASSAVDQITKPPFDVLIGELRARCERCTHRV